MGHFVVSNARHTLELLYTSTFKVIPVVTAMGVVQSVDKVTCFASVGVVIV